MIFFSFSPNWLLLNIFMAALVGIIGHSKGTGFAGWFLFGLLFWPLTIFFALFSSSKPKCTACRQHIEPDATRCHHCGQDVVDAGQDPATWG